MHGNGSADFEAMSRSKTRYNNIAAQNNIIILYPRFKGGYASYLMGDSRNSTQDGIFPKVIMAMIDHLKNGSCPE
jgi:hypothetical protein